MNSRNVRFDAHARQVQAEAVAWHARLRAPGRTRALEEGLRTWLGASPDNAAAFEKATELWDELGGVSAAALLQSRTEVKRELPKGWTRHGIAAGAAASIVALVGAIATFGWKSESDLSTRIGEQRIVTLKDGSRVALNTNTRVVIEPWNGTREVQLDRGEAYFEVSKDPERPFVVVAGDKQVVAIGTAFVVRRDPNGDDEKVSVTLVEGKVAVVGREVKPQAVLINEAQIPVLTAGQRMVLVKSAPSTADIDLPKIEAVTAWRHGEIVLDNAALKDAVAELNRYSSVVLSIEGEGAADLPVSGIFRTGDSESFAIAVATLYGLAIVREPQKLVLSGKPSFH